MLLLLPAVLNGFPLLFYDSGGYVERGLTGTLAPGRSLVYGQFATILATTPLGLWPGIALQAAATLWAFWLLARVHGAGAHAFLLITAMAALTGVAWYVSQVMPDILAGLMILALYLLSFCALRLSFWERVGLASIVALAVAAHMAHLALALVLVLPVILLRTLSVRFRHARPILPLAAAGLGVAVLAAAGWLATGRPALTPGGAVFVLGRLVQDGIAQAVLDQDCPNPAFAGLCAARAHLPRSANDFLWGRGPGTVDGLGGWDTLEAEARHLVLRSVVRMPGRQAATALVAGAEQFMNFRTAGGLASGLWFVTEPIERLLPHQVAAFRAARQQSDPRFAEAAWPTQSPVNTLNLLHRPVGFLSLGLCLVMVMAAALRSPSGRGAVDEREALSSLALLAGFILAALAANAVICGALSNPSPRYQGRVIWLASIPPILWLLRRWRHSYFP
ncbi:hypothetical protein [Zavarzinia sp. CC-PAN008]|uniref:hypothetical protein n=1 Tax=Zavarzinia sp. CC-PAN008 TaxID=3243332 RepID=UPI003F74469A